jgi:uncharacterized protein YdaU (DUF1376 family)
MSAGWMPFWVGDYLADTRHLSTIEHGAYLLLMMHYWQHDGLPNDDRKLARIAGLSLKQWATYRPTLAEFFDDEWRHGRLQHELSVSLEKSATARVKAEKRWKNKGTPDAVAEPGQMPGQCQSQSQSHKEANASLDRSPEQPVIPGRSDDFASDVEAVALGLRPSASPAPDVPLPRPAAKERAPPRAKGIRIPPDITLTAAMIEIARKEGLSDEHISKQFRRFCDYWVNANGPSSLKFDWEGAAWRNWCGKAVDGFGGVGGYAARGNGRADASRLGAAQRAAARFLDETHVSEQRPDLRGDGGGSVVLPLRKIG